MDYIASVYTRFNFKRACEVARRLFYYSEVFVRSVSYESGPPPKAQYQVDVSKIKNTGVIEERTWHLGCEHDYLAFMDYVLYGKEKAQ